MTTETTPQPDEQEPAPAPSFVESFLTSTGAPATMATALALLDAAEQNYGAWNVSQIEAFFRDLRELLTRLGTSPISTNEPGGAA